MSKEILAAVKVSESSWQLGHEKVFLRYGLQKKKSPKDKPLEMKPRPSSSRTVKLLSTRPPTRSNVSSVHGACVASLCKSARPPVSFKSTLVAW